MTLKSGIARLSGSDEGSTIMVLTVVGTVGGASVAHPVSRSRKRTTSRLFCIVAKKGVHDLEKMPVAFLGRSVRMISRCGMIDTGFSY